MSAWLSPQSLAALAVTLIFVAVALQRPARAVLAYSVLGAAPSLIQLGAFSGRTISQGLLLAEALATVLFGAWLTQRRSAPLLRAPFDGPLYAFAAVCAASMVGILLLPDYRIAANASLAVSFGQLLLVVWPIGVYLAAAEFITETSQLRWIHRAVVALAIAQIAAAIAPKPWEPYLGWAPTFGLFASPLALAAVFSTPSVAARAYYVVITLLPLVLGVLNGKAFLYGFVAVSGLAIMWLRASRLAAFLAAAAATVMLVAVGLFGEEALLLPAEVLLNKERSQMSFGGNSGRGALAAAAVSIWQQAPILGVGPGNSYVYMLQRSPIGTPHNQYLNLLVEFGILGLLSWLVFLVVAWRTGLRIYREATVPAHRTFALGWLGMFAGMVAGGITGDFMIHSIRNGGLELFSGYYLQWVLLGGLVAIPGIERRLRAPHTAATPRPRFWRASPPRPRRPVPAAAVASSAAARLWTR
ncbi:MAG: O-antigen ligase family protein [Vicinamibacterales bacterium]